MGDHIPSSTLGLERIGPGRTSGPSSIGPGKIGRKRLGGQSLGRDPSMLPKGYDIFGRIPNVDKDGDPFTKRSPNKKPGNNSFF